MIKQIGAIAIALFMVGCQTEQAEEVTESREYKKLLGEVEQLRVDRADQQIVINDAISIFGEIESNIQSISQKEGEIRIKSNDIELFESSKDFIIDEIKMINELRQRNESKLLDLRNKLKEKDGMVHEFEQLVESLQRRIREQENELGILKIQLEDLDLEYATLFDAYQNEVSLKEEALIDLNRAYYTIGSTKELKNQGVIDKQGGFLGIGKIKKLKAGFNKDYFTEIDIRKSSSISILGKKPRILTNHPKESYELDVDDATSKLVIKDAKNFWSVSKYLVVNVD